MFMVGFFFFFQAEDGIRDYKVTGVQTCALPIWVRHAGDLRPDEARPVGDHLRLGETLLEPRFRKVAAQRFAQRRRLPLPAFGHAPPLLPDLGPLMREAPREVPWRGAAQLARAPDNPPNILRSRCHGKTY